MVELLVKGAKFMTTMAVYFSHGLESGPWGTKINAMAEVARAAGAKVESVDYQGMPDPTERVDKLLLEAANQQSDSLILVGSSMGGHVSAAAASRSDAAGLFLLAPAFFMPGYEALTPPPADCPIEIVHGWHDDVVPVDNSIRYARDCAATLHLINSDHRLTDSVDVICELLAAFLSRFK